MMEMGAILLTVAGAAILLCVVKTWYDQQQNNTNQIIPMICCPKCCNPRTSRYEPITMDGKKVKTMYLIKPDPLTPPLAIPTDLVCLNCGHEWKEKP
jgi:hypothetical protein